MQFVRQAKEILMKIGIRDCWFRLEPGSSRTNRPPTVYATAESICIFSFVALLGGCEGRVRFPQRAIGYLTREGIQPLPEDSLLNSDVEKRASCSLCGNVSELTQFQIEELLRKAEEWIASTPTQRP